jgi:hypothetical protein
MFHCPCHASALERGCGARGGCGDAPEKLGCVRRGGRGRGRGRAGQVAAAVHEQTPTGLDSRQWMMSNQAREGKEGQGE